MFKRAQNMKSAVRRSLFASGSGERRGAAVVEFAMIAPLFLLLLGGLIEFGQAFRIQHMLSTAARRGARAAITEGTTYAQVQQKVKADCVQTLGVNGTDITVVIKVEGTVVNGLTQTEQGDEIAVTASVPFSKAGAGFISNFFGSTVLNSTCIFERE